MGRNVYITAVNISKLQKNFIGLNTNKLSEKEKNPEKEYLKLLKNPQLINAEDLYNIESVIWDNINSEYSSEEIRKLKSDYGFHEIFQIATTNPSCTFMELVYLLLPDIDNWEYNHFLCNRKRFVNFINKLLILGKCFLSKENLSRSEKIVWPEMNLAADFFSLAEEIYHEQVQKRIELGSEYSQKWGADYFNFFNNYTDSLLKLKKYAETNNDEFYFMYDSY